jgi:hypothetical protein
MAFNLSGMNGATLVGVEERGVSSKSIVLGCKSNEKRLVSGEQAIYKDTHDCENLDQITNPHPSQSHEWRSQRMLKKNG